MDLQPKYGCSSLNRNEAMTSFGRCWFLGWKVVFVPAQLKGYRGSLWVFVSQYECVYVSKTEWCLSIQRYLENRCGRLCEVWVRDRFVEVVRWAGLAYAWCVGTSRWTYSQSMVALAQIETKPRQLLVDADFLGEKWFSSQPKWRDTEGVCGCL